MLQYEDLTKAMINEEIVESGPDPPYLNDKVLSFNPRVFFDGHPLGKNFGTVKVEPKKDYYLNETVEVIFIAGNPRNNILHEKTYLTVEKEISEGQWKVLLTDGNWETK